MTGYGKSLLQHVEVKKCCTTDELTSVIINEQCAVRCHSTMNNADLFTWLLILKHVLERSGKVGSVGGFYEILCRLT